MTLYLLAFTICSTVADPATGAAGCEMGEVTHRSCQFAEAYVRTGLRPGQVLHVSSCEALR